MKISAKKLTVSFLVLIISLFLIIYFYRLILSNKTDILSSDQIVSKYKAYDVSGDYDSAQKVLFKGAEEGNHVAMSFLGYSHYYGRIGLKQDYQLALKWYLKAADNGSIYAMGMVGDMYMEGLGVKQNYQQAMQWFLKGANKNNREAIYNIGIMYKDGLGVAKDYTKAKEWFKKASYYQPAIDALKELP